VATNRAVRKKLGKKFKVGDVVTWGLRVIAHRVVKLDAAGVFVDTTSADIGVRQKDGRLWMLVPFVPVRAYGYAEGPPEHTDMIPDQPKAKP
jgi:hypothetical protein